MIAWRNGQFTADDVLISTNAKAVTQSAAVFDGARVLTDARGAYIFNLEGHLARFQRSCEALCLPISFSARELDSVISEVIRKNRPQEAMGLRLFALAREGRRSAQESAEVVVFLRSLRGYALERPYRLVISRFKRFANSGVPHHVKAMSHYALGRVATNEALAAGFDDAVFVNEDGNVTETPRASLVFIRGGEALTPAVSDGVLPGLTRYLVRRVCQIECGLSWVERSIPVSEISTMEAAVMCSSSLGIVTVEKIGSVTFPVAPSGETISDNFKRLTGPERAAWNDILTEFPLHQEMIQRRA
ncbi:aminotransferase class IV [Bradyrhizobium sp. USDA 336]|uniref:aminotransferase class IV n=1 Tax=Bradyrhizobium sp. USDA 336 TaxID=3156311 RepID=UPI0038389AF1